MIRFRWTIGRKVFVVTSMLVLAQLLFAAMLAGNIIEFRRAVLHERYVHDLLRLVSNVNQEFLSLEVSGDNSSHIEEFVNETITKVEQTLANFSKISQSKDLLIFERFINILREAQQSVRSQTNLNHAVVGVKVWDSLFFFDLDAFQCLQFHETDSFEQQMGAIRLLKQVLILGMPISAVVALFVALWLIREVTSRLRTLQLKTRRIAMGHDPGGFLSGDDEIHDLDQTFHHMASQLKLSQMEEQRLLNQVLDCVCSIDHMGRVASANDACKHIFGMSSDDLTGRRYIDTIELESRANTRQMFENATINGRQQFETRVTRLDGSIADVLWSVQWSEGQRFWFSIIHDITPQKELERRRQEFVSIASHDLRSPLTSLSLSLNMLEMGVRGPLPAEALHEVSCAKTTVEKLIELINSMLDTAKYELGSWPALRESASLASIFDELKRSTDERAKTSKHSINYPDSSMIVEVDSAQVVRCLTMLLNIALEFTKSDINVEIDAKKGNIELKVLFAGEVAFFENGIDDFDQLHLLKMIEHPNGLSTYANLAVCNEIAKAHSGKIGFRAQTDATNVFWMRFKST